MLAGLSPLAGLSANRLAELTGLCSVQRMERGCDPLAAIGSGRCVFLLTGELLLVFATGGTQLLVGAGEDARHAFNRRGQLARTKAITDIELLLIDDDVLDIALTWDQLAALEQAGPSATGTAVQDAAGRDSRLLPGAFSISSLRNGGFAQLPAAHIEELLSRLERINVRRDEAVIREGDEGDYYYVVESGRFRVERRVGGTTVVLAELKSGDPFGEEALVADAKRNATVMALTNGALLRLARADFDRLLKEPLLQKLTIVEARERVVRGAVWLDVRFPSEYQFDKLPGAINVPLNEVRNMFAVLDKSQEYIVYCQSGRRSSAAAFLFAQRGFKASVLEGGLWAADRSA